MSKLNIPKERKRLIKVLFNQMKTIGFVVLKNVPGYDQDELFKTANAFHNEIPMADKD